MSKEQDAFIAEYLRSMALNPMAGPQDFPDPNSQYQFMPEYSVTKGWLPVDIGTMQQNQNFWEDQNRWAADPIVGIQSGSFDPSAYEDVVTTELPEAPETPKLDLYGGEGAQPEMQALIGLLERGYSPKAAVDQLVVTGVIPDPWAEDNLDSNGKPMRTDDYDYLVAEASSLQPEVAALRKYQSQEPVETRESSEAMKHLEELGIPNPNERFGPETFEPNLPLLSEHAGNSRVRQEDAEKKVDYVRELTMKRATHEPTGLKEDDRGIMRPTWDGEYNDENRRPMMAQPVTRQNPMGAGRSAGRERQRALGDDGGVSARHNAQREWVGGAQNAALAHLAALVSQKRGTQQAQAAAAANFTPATAALMGRAGL